MGTIVEYTCIQAAELAANRERQAVSSQQIFSHGRPECDRAWPEAGLDRIGTESL